jgi:glycosyltransferase 2 family protein
MRLRNIQVLAGLACTFLFLGLALSRVSLSALLAALANAEAIWLAAAILVYATNLSLRAWRWQIILRPVVAIPYPGMARALLVGYGLNTIMPARLGELFRAELLKRDFGLSRISALTSIVIERLFDGLTVVACLGLGLLLAATTKHNSAVLGEVLVTAGAVFGLILLAAIALSGRVALRLITYIPRLSPCITTLQQGLAILRTRRIVAVAALTLMIYAPDALSLWCIVKSLGLGLGFTDTLVLLGAASLSTLLPSGPAFLGTLQFAYALAIEFAGAPTAIGIAAATLCQLCLLIPIAVAAAGVLAYGSGRVLRTVLARQECKPA